MKEPFHVYETSDGNDHVGMAMDLPNGFTLFLVDWRPEASFNELSDELKASFYAIRFLLLKGELGKGIANDMDI